MPKLINNNIKSSSRINNSRLALNKKTMRREFIFPLIVGIVLGVMVMILWQFNGRLNNQRAAMAQLQQVTAQNSQTVNDIVAFINQATNPQGTQNNTPAQ